jgi:hypothetical protein
MMALPPKPRFDKKMHHVVPKGWQRKFAPAGAAGPYCKNVLTGQTRGPEGPGDKMAEQYANIIFDEYYRPSDALEDQLSKIETKALPALDRVMAAGQIGTSERVDIAYLLAVQACRYPERYNDRLELGKLLAIELKDCARMQDAAEMNQHLRRTGLLPGASFTDDEFRRLSSALAADLAKELNAILSAHGYEAFFNPELVIAAALPLAEHLLGLEWQLLSAAVPSFILSDRPMPPIRVGYEFSLGLTATFGLRVRYPRVPVTEQPIVAQSATGADITAINNEVRSRAREWICGPEPWVAAM